MDSFKADHRQAPAPVSPVRRPGARTLVDARFDQDSCGVGFVASIDAIATHTILEQACTALGRLAHRGAVAADGKSSDGVGLMTAIPRELLLAACGETVASDVAVGVGMLFLPADSAADEAAIERCLVSQDLRVQCWRDVPTEPGCLGEIALSTIPKIRQVFVVNGEAGDAETMERRLYLARKQFERMQESGAVAGYVCSLSTRTLVYKAMCSGKLLRDFYPDLCAKEYVTPFAIFHQRYATNTTPTWHRAQPGRMLAHNGEINTVWGNRARMAARDATLPVECKPVLTSGGTDSTSLDEAVELLTRNGRTTSEAVRMLLPPASIGHQPSSFLRYNMDCAEPWDGPAAISFSDGRVVGAALDRNGLRPCRFAITLDGLVVAGSEAGLVDLDPERVTHSGRLGPGQMIVVDLAEHTVYENDALLALLDAGTAYLEMPAEGRLEGIACAGPDAAALLTTQRGFGYTREDVKMILQPMAAEGKDAVWSMGDDTPLAFLARAPRPVYAYFRQRFAQVTNPAIDPLREACVVSLHTRLGPWPHLLDKNAMLPGVSLESPFLSTGQMAALREGSYSHVGGVAAGGAGHASWRKGRRWTAALDTICDAAIDLVRNGARILLLSDRTASPASVPVPMAMATGAVHQALVAAGLRTLAGLAVEAGDVRDIHHAAVLIGYGAGAVCPWLALETGMALTASRGRARGERSKDAEGARRGAGEGDVEDGDLGGGQLPGGAPFRYAWSA